MKITELFIPAEETALKGLKEVKMDRLGQVVVLAGKNGSGKTRLIQLVKEQIQKVPTVRQAQDIRLSITQHEKNIVIHKSQISSLEAALLKTGLTAQQKESYESTLKQHHRGLESTLAAIEENNKQLSILERIKISPSKESNSFVDFVPKQITLRDSYIISDQDLDGYAQHVYNVGTDSIHEGAIPAIQKIVKRSIVANSVASVPREDKQKAVVDFERLKKYIKIFLDTDLDINVDGQATLFGKRIGEARLSDGQKILLQFCLALFAQEAKLDDLIIFMDEPENRLHPSALNDVLDKITPYIKNGQLWIATHSINVLAHFDSTSIHYIENGAVSYAGNIPEKVLGGLLGDENEIQKLSQLLLLPTEVGAIRFAYECLFYPKVAFTSNEDVQLKQINELISQLRKEKKQLKVLDFGIGKGRLLASIHENERIKGKDAKEWLDFYGYDDSSECRDWCINVLDSVYGTSADRYFNNDKDLLVKHDEKTFDMIVMCNVFHEIEPAKWLPLFNSANSIFKLLKDDGFLLLVEDQLLAVGEKAHSKGFIVFDSLELKKLFKIPASDIKSFDYRGDGRLMAHYIPRKFLFQADTTSKKDALSCLVENAKKEITKVRSLTPPSYKNGRRLGFWTQQLANALLALEES